MSPANANAHTKLPTYTVEFIGRIKQLLQLIKRRVVDHEFIAAHLGSTCRTPRQYQLNSFELIAADRFSFGIRFPLTQAHEANKNENN